MESYKQVPSILVIGETLISFLGNFKIPLVGTGVWEHVPEFLDSKFDFDVLRESGISQFQKKVNLIEKL